MALHCTAGTDAARLWPAIFGALGRSATIGFRQSPSGAKPMATIPFDYLISLVTEPVSDDEARLTLERLLEMRAQVQAGELQGAHAEFLALIEFAKLVNLMTWVARSQHILMAPEVFDALP